MLVIRKITLFCGNVQDTIFSDNAVAQLMHLVPSLTDFPSLLATSAPFKNYSISLYLFSSLCLTPCSFPHFLEKTTKKKHSKQSKKNQIFLHFFLSSPSLFLRPSRITTYTFNIIQRQKGSKTLVFGRKSSSNAEMAT